MGRTKQKKPKKQRTSGRRVDEIAAVLVGTDPDDLWVKLTAAGASPGGRHRWTAIGATVAAALRAEDAAPTRGERQSTLQHAVDSVAQAAGIDIRYEDFIATDPTLRVRTRLDDELLDLFPGTVERPIADITRALRFADVLDDILTERHGFGIGNVLRVALRYADRAIAAVADSWQPKPDLGLGDPIDVATAELDAVQRFVADQPDLALTDADSRALEWMTTAGARAHYTPDGVSGFGRFLRFRVGSNPVRERWVPIAFIPEVLQAATAELVLSIEADNKMAARVRRSVRIQTRDALLRFDSTVIGAPDHFLGANSHAVDWVVPFSPTSVLAVQVVPVMRDLDTPHEFAVELLATSARNASEPVEVPFAHGGLLTLPAGTEIVPLLVFAGATHLMAPQRNGCATAALEDLTWIAETADDNGDLLAFARELADPNLPPLFGWETINLWEPWRANGKQLFPGGVMPSAAMFEAHAGEAEWERAAELNTLEAALLNVGLPPLRDAQLADITSGRPKAVFAGDPFYNERHGTYEAPIPDAWAVTSTSPPVAFPVASDDWDRGNPFTLLSDLGGGLAFAVDSIDEQWAQAHHTSTARGYRVRFESSDDSSPIAGSTTDISPTGLTGYTTWRVGIESFADRADGNPTATNEMCAAPLADMVRGTGTSDADAEHIRAALIAAPPFLIMERKESRTARFNLPSPVRFDDAEESRMTRILAERIAGSSTRPATYRGTAANALVRDLIAPTAREELRRRIRVHDPREVISYGLEQLVRVADARERSVGNLQRVARHLTTAWDPTERMALDSADFVRLRQANEILIEAAVQDLTGAPDMGSAPAVAPIDGHAWRKLLAAADAYLAITQHSERLHHGITPVEIELTDLYELRVRPDLTDHAAEWPLDSASLNMATAASNLDDVDPIESVASTRVINNLDAAMLHEFGATREDIYFVLIALTQWDRFEDAANIARASPDEVEQWVFEAVDTTDEARRARLRAATRLLTSSSQTLAGEWEPWLTRTRRHRLLVQPIVQVDADLLIAPQFMTVALGVYNNYLTQGMLPWSAPPTAQLGQALAALRAERNKHFEAAVAEALNDEGFTTVSRIKPGDGARIGVPELTSEIDIVAARPGDNTVWLLEAKDPAAVFGIMETARQLQTFYRDRPRSNGRTSPSYATQLARKDDEVRPYVREVARKLGAAAPEQAALDLQTVFVTRGITAAGFILARFPVLTLDDLLADVRSGRAEGGSTDA